MARNPIRRTGRLARYNRGRLVIKKLAKRYKKKRYNRSRLRNHAPYKQYKLKGFRQRINNKPEIKYTIKTPPQINAFVSSILWHSNDIQPDNTQHYTIPNSGVAENQFIGTKLNSLYHEVIFHIRPDPALIQAQPGVGAVSEQGIRIAVLRHRNPKQNQDQTATNQPFTNLSTPIDTKVFDIQFEKTYWRTLGTFGNTQPQSEMMPSMKFRFKIPMKRTLSIQTINFGAGNQAAIQYPFPVFIYIYSNVSFMNIQYRVNKFVYRDP